jgi:putative transposase
MSNQEPFDFEAFKQDAIKKLRNGKSLTGTEGILTPLIKQFLEGALQAEIESHLDQEERGSGNRKNGKTRKTVKSSEGQFELETPRDRNGSFEPEIVKKREVFLGEDLENKIVSLYGIGMSLRDISKHIQEMYGTEVSAATLSSITDKIIPQIKEWQSRPLDSVYTFVWLDAMHYKVKEEGRIVSRAVYNILGVTTSGMKDLIGIYVSESEGANFWLQILTDLRNRGVQDILIASIDNLKGFAEAIKSIYPETEVQTCIVHQIRNSLKYVASKDQKAFIKDLKLVYQAVNKSVAEDNLNLLEDKWGKKYPVVISSWRNNWDKLTTYFKYTEEIRRTIYTTNAIEGFHRQVRKVTKTKGAFTSDMALIKLIYLTVQNISAKWKMPLRNWSLTISQLSIMFKDRLKLTLNN